MALIIIIIDYLIFNKFNNNTNSKIIIFIRLQCPVHHFSVVNILVDHIQYKHYCLYNIQLRVSNFDHILINEDYQI